MATTFALTANFVNASGTGVSGARVSIVPTDREGNPILLPCDGNSIVPNAQHQTTSGTPVVFELVPGIYTLTYNYGMVITTKTFEMPAEDSALSELPAIDGSSTLSDSSEESGESGTGSGLSEQEVEALVEAGVADWAEEGNADAIPANKLINAPSGSEGLTEEQVDARVQAGVFDWAEEGNADAIPANKLINAPSGSEGLTEEQVDARVQAGVFDWAEEGNGETIPASKLSEALLGVENWAETGNFDPIPADKLINAPVNDGLSEEQVDARVQAGVFDWAEEGNADAIPAGKLVNALGVADWAEEGNDEPIPEEKLTNAPGLDVDEVDTRVRIGVSFWAEQGNPDPIPADKLINAPPSGTDGLNQDQVDARIRLNVEAWAQEGNDAAPVPAAKAPRFLIGTRTSPSITFDSDRNTGFYRRAENVIGVSSGGLETITISSTAVIFNSPVQLPTGSTINGQPIGSGGSTDALTNVLTGVTYLTQVGVGNRRVELVGTTLSFINFDGQELEALRFRLNVGKMFSISNAGEGFVFLITSAVTETVDRLTFEYNAIRDIGTGSILNGAVANVNFLADTFAIQDWAREGNEDIIPANKLPTVLDHRWKLVHTYRLANLDGLNGPNAPNVQDNYGSFSEEGRAAYFNWFSQNQTKEFFATIKTADLSTVHAGGFFGVLDNTPEENPNRNTSIYIEGFLNVPSINGTTINQASIFFEFRNDGLTNQDQNIPLLIGFPYLTGQSVSPLTTEVIEFYVREPVLGEDQVAVESWATTGNATPIPSSKLVNTPSPSFRISRIVNLPLDGMNIGPNIGDTGSLNYTWGQMTEAEQTNWNALFRGSPPGRQWNVYIFDNDELSDDFFPLHSLYQLFAGQNNTRINVVGADARGMNFHGMIYDNPSMNTSNYKVYAIEFEAITPPVNVAPVDSTIIFRLHARTIITSSANASSFWIGKTLTIRNLALD